MNYDEVLNMHNLKKIKMPFASYISKSRYEKWFDIHINMIHNSSRWINIIKRFDIECKKELSRYKKFSNKRRRWSKKEFFYMKETICEGYRNIYKAMLNQGSFEDFKLEQSQTESSKPSCEVHQIQTNEYEISEYEDDSEYEENNSYTIDEILSQYEDYRKCFKESKR